MKKLFLFVFVLAIAFVGVGFYRGWFTASSAQAGSKKGGLVLTWDLDKLKADMGKLKTMSKNALDGIKSKAKSVSATESELEGRVKSVDAANHTVVLDADGHDIPLVVSDTANAEQLIGKDVRVTLHKTGDTMIVTRIAER